MIRGAIFDFDGTLFDSMHVWDEAPARLLHSLGRTPQDDLARTLAPMSMQEGARYLKKAYALPLSEQEIQDGVNRCAAQAYRNEILPKPGAAQFVHQLCQAGVSCCIATVTAEPLVLAALSRCGMTSLFCGVVSCRQYGKENPDVYLRACRLLQTACAQTLVFEDSRFALQTAKDAGFIPIAVYDAHEQNQPALRALSRIYLEDFSNFETFWTHALRL